MSVYFESVKIVLTGQRTRSLPEWLSLESLLALPSEWLASLQGGTLNSAVFLQLLGLVALARKHPLSLSSFPHR